MIPDLETLKQIAKHGGVTVEWLLRGDQTPPLQEFAPEAYDTRPAVLHLDYLARALLLARQFLKKRRLHFSEPQEAELISYVYEYLEEKHADPGDVVLARLADLIRRRPESL